MAALNGHDLSGAREQVRDFLASMQDLLDTLNREGVETTSALRERISAGIDAVKYQYEHSLQTLDDEAEAVGNLIRDNPWVAVGTGAVIGIALGCVATQGVLAVSERGGFAGASRQISQGAARLQRQYRPYVRRARRAVSDHWPF